MRFKRKKGVALIVVMMVMLVLSILGISFLSVSTFQNNHAIRQDRGLHAHYLARAGAEAALKAWQDAPSTAKPTGTFDPVYLDASNDFVNTPADLKGKFEVTITPNGTSNVIHSIGTVGNVQKDVTVIINEIHSDIPGPTPSYIDGSTTGFYDNTSGQINSGLFPSSGSNRGTVKNEAKNGKGLKFVNKTRPTSTLTFEHMLFSSSIQVLHNSIILVSNVIVFTEPVDYSANGNSKGALILKVYGSTASAVPISITGYLGNWGVVSFSGVGYYYKDIINGVVLRTESDIASNVSEGYLVPITDQSILDGYLSGVIPTTLHVKSYTILWSK